MYMIGHEKSKRHYTKEGKLQSIIMDGLKDFLEMFQKQKKGRRSLENQHVYDAIMAAINSGELTNKN